MACPRHAEEPVAMTDVAATKPQGEQREFDAYRRDLEQANLELQQEIAERRRVEAALRAYAQRLDHQHATQVALLSAKSLTDTLDITIQHIKSVLPSFSATIVMYDFDQGELEVLSSDRPELRSGHRLPILMGEAIAELRQGRHYYISDAQDPAQSRPGIQTTTAIGGRSILMIPLLYRDDLIGAMTVTTGEVHDFSAEELVVASEIAGSLAIAIQHRRWLWAEQEARERESTLRQVAQSLTADLDLDMVLRGILDQLEKIVPTTSSSIFLREGDGMRVVASRGVRMNPDALERFVTSYPTMMRQPMNTGEAYIITDTRTDPRWITIEGSNYILSWMGIPLTVKGQTIGIMTLDRDTVDSFDEQDMARATIVAAQAAIGIENARLFRREQEAAVRLEQEVRKRTRALEALYEISAAASQNLDTDLLLHFSLSRTLSAMGCSAGAIHVLDDGTGDLSPVAMLGLTNDKLAYLAADMPVTRLLRRQLARSGGPWHLDAAVREEWALCSGYESCVVAPLRAHGRTMGTMLLLSHTRHQSAPDVQSLLAAIADQIGLAIESIELRRHARQAAVLAERERIARDLHDVVTQSLYSLINFAEAARETAVNGDLDEVQKNVQTVMQTAHQALGEMRMLLYDLRSDVLISKGLHQALADRLATVEQRAGLATELYVEGAELLPPALEDVLYRVALEALNNAFRHANARSVIVRLMAIDEVAVLRVTDDGVGFAVDEIDRGAGMGLSNMRRRVHEAGGALHIRSIKTQGTELEFRIPFNSTVATSATITRGSTR